MLGNESSLLSTCMVLSDTDILPFGDVFKISVEQDRLYSCTVQLHVVGVTDSQEQCWVIVSLVFLRLDLLMCRPCCILPCCFTFCCFYLDLEIEKGKIANVEPLNLLGPCSVEQSKCF